MQLQETLDAPLLGSQGEKWRHQPRVVPEELSLWIEAQSLSEDASRKLVKNLDDIFPLERTKECRVVDAMWTRINDVGTFENLSLTALMHITDVQSSHQNGLGHTVAGRGRIFTRSAMEYHSVTRKAQHQDGRTLPGA